MASYREEEDPFEEDIVFDQARLLTNTTKMNTAIRRVSSGKCALFAKTLGLCGAFFGLGLCIAIPGPTFLSPVTDLQADSSPISNIYAARTSGYLIGSLIGGFLFDYFNRLFLLFISLLLTAVFITVTPWCQVLWLLEACMVFLGMSMGFLDTGGNVLCLDLWGRNSGPFMQALHFSFGLGAFVAPLLAAPFLETSSIESLPAVIASTAMPSQVPDFRGRREISKLENSTPLFINESDIWLDASTQSSSLVFPFTVSSTLRLPELSTLSSLEINNTTTQPHLSSTTQRKHRKKPLKTHVQGNSREGEHVGIPPIEDRLPLTTSRTTIPTTESTTMPNNKNSTSNVFSKTTLVRNELSISTSINEAVGSTSPTTSKVSTATSSSTINQFTSSGFVSPNPEFFSNSMKMLRGNVSTTLSKEPNTNSNLGEYLYSSESPVFHTTLNDYVTNKILSIKSNVTEKKGVNNEIQKNLKENTSHNQTPGSVLESRSENDSRSFPSTTPLSINLMPTQKETNKSHIEEHKILAVSNPVYSTEVQELYSVTSRTTFPKHIHHKPVTYDNDTEPVSTIFDIIANKIEKYGFSKVQFTYLMVGLFVFTISLVFLGFLCHNPRDPKSKQEEGQSTKKISNKALHYLLISLMAIFFLLYVGLEVTYGQLVLAFAVNGDLQLTRSTGLVIAIVFWGSFAAMRFASIFFSSGFGPITMLLLNFVFCTLGTILLSTMASHAETALWIGTALLGIGLASVFPTGILWIERYIHVSNKVAAAFVTGASLGEMVCPIAVYHLMVNNPAMLMHSAVVINILCIVTFIALRWLALRHGEKYSATNNNGYQLANQDEEEDMIDMSPSGSAIALHQHNFSSEHRALLNGNPHRGP